MRDRLETLESDVYKHQILMSKVDPRTERVNHHRAAIYVYKQVETKWNITEIDKITW